MRVAPYLFYEGAHTELAELFVEAGYRCQEVRQASIEYAEHLAKEREAKELILHTDKDNQASRAFCTARGFEEWEIVMGKSLVSK